MLAGPVDLDELDRWMKKTMRLRIGPVVAVDGNKGPQGSAHPADVVSPNRSKP
jgi:hypothetical protein